ncbi:hypothetical protein Pan161_00190 [Gimesia algae]|uniref:Uncharacterized protein n=1 Tax=Gimesia algae TaxID=2527971 RepID=A0A517V5Z6_9PLAN|nr:hypothetical protein Pan161_00190 [Gimesia algae]
MSLLVNVFKRGPDDEMLFIKVEQHKELAGFENWRETLYGSPQSVLLGLRLLPELNRHDLYCSSPTDLDCLLTECNTLLAHLDRYPQDSESITYRVQNIIDAVILARESEAEVVIW